MSSPSLCHGCCKEHPLPATNIQGMWFCEDYYARLLKNNTIPCIECGQPSTLFTTRCIGCFMKLMGARINKRLKEKQPEVGFGE